MIVVVSVVVAVHLAAVADKKAAVVAAGVVGHNWQKY